MLLGFLHGKLEVLLLRPAGSSLGKIVQVQGALDVLAPAATQLCQVCEQQPETSALTSHGHVQ